MKFKQITIVGMGLIGGSIGMALRKRFPRVRIIGVSRRRSTLMNAKRMKAAHEFTSDLEKGIKGSDLIIVATPVESIIPLVRKIAPLAGKAAVITDVGSVKGVIMRSLASLKNFVGSHPMAGSEKTGVKYGNPDLFKGSVCIVVSSSRNKGGVVRKLEEFWGSIGCKTIRSKSADHDAAVALISHLPHLLAASLVLSADSYAARYKKIWALTAGSFRDATRVAMSDPLQWQGIFDLNSAELIRAYKVFGANLKMLLRRKDKIKLLSRSKDIREKLGGST